MIRVAHGNEHGAEVAGIAFMNAAFLTFHPDYGPSETMDVQFGPGKAATSGKRLLQPYT
jgi:hypothetical protein